MLKVEIRTNLLRVLGVLLLGVATSSIGQTTCFPVPSGIVSWWPAENSIKDFVGSNNGQSIGGIGFVSGEVGQAFSFSGNGDYISVPDSPTLSFTNDFSIELWYKDTGLSGYGGLVAKRPTSPVNAPCNFGLTIISGAPSTFLVYLLDSNIGSYGSLTYTGLPAPGAFHHLAATFHQQPADQIQIKEYLDGQLVAIGTISGNLVRTVNNAPLTIGASNATGEFFKGNIDELSIYNRLLSDAEISGIFNAGIAGKCINTAPYIVVQPTNATVLIGQSVTLNVIASGAQPLNYQWRKDGSVLSSATNSFLTLTNVQTTQSGTYLVEVTNLLGSIQSSNVVLTVNPPPPCITPPADLVAWWPGEGDATDLVGTDNGSATSGITFVPGEVGTAFSFDGTTGAVIVPGSLALNVQSVTIEAWIFPTDVSIPRPILEYADPTGPCSLNFWYSTGVSGQSSPGALFAFARDSVNPSSTFAIASPGSLLPSNQWSHVAFTFDSMANKSALYLNGSVVAISTPAAVVHPNTRLAVNLGYRPVGSSDLNAGRRHAGQLDEVSVYRRALSSSEILAIYNASVTGKCKTPVAPIVLVQPTNQTVFELSTPTMVTAASGTPPLSFQWAFNGTDLPDATNEVLVLHNVETNQSGVYSVRITNLVGSVTSSNATLTVNPHPPCTPPPSQLVSWWQAEGDPIDSVGGNNGALVNGATFSPGEVGQGFSFNGSGSYVQIPDNASLSFTNDFSIELWYRDGGLSAGAYGGLIGKRPTFGACNFGLTIIGGTPGTLLVYLEDPKYGSYKALSYSGVPAAGAFHHLAATFHQQPADQIQLKAYVDGQLVQTTAIPGNLARATNNSPVDIGCSNPNGEFFKGNIDEVSIYSKLLSDAEVASIYLSGNLGKCSTPIPAYVFTQPSGQIVTIGQNATLTGGGAGTHPLFYQWLYNGLPIAGATNSSLVLTNVQMSQAGNYSVLVTNAYGSALSSNAALVVNFPPANVNVVSTSGSAGRVITVPVVLVANGNENAIGFSLNYSPTNLTAIGVALGTGAAGGSLQFNTNQAGAVGIGVALSSGATFAAGTQEVAEISFMSAVAQNAYSVPLTFGDQPIKRELSDPTVNLLAAKFNGGQVSLSRSAFEADVAPRPDGDGAVSIVDWVQVGRYVAALDSPTNASEFQRADCAPRSTFGDGQLTVSDWVQAGRYAAGLDPLSLADGPTAPAGPGIVTKPLRKEGSNPTRTVLVQGPLIFPGQTGTALVELDAQGDENAIGLSLAFDPKVVSYAGASLGADAANATFDINANQSTNGQLGVILALPTDISFTPGTRQVLKVNFQPLTTNSVNSTVALTDLPVRREVSDTNALPVAATYASGTIVINPKPALSISHVGQNINVTWPFWATNYFLQQAGPNSLSTSTWTNLSVSPVLTNSSLNVTLPLSGSVQFYRLQHQ